MNAGTDIQPKDFQPIVTTWWHGGPRISGDMLLPPRLTGSWRVCEGDPWVYITPVRSLALHYASTAYGWFYEVEPIGSVEQDPGSILPAGQSMRCRQARILRRFRPSRIEAERARAAVAWANERLIFASGSEQGTGQ